MGDNDLAFAGVAGQLTALDRGTTTAEGLVSTALSRIELLNPQINAFVTVVADAALARARDADRARAQGDRRPLLGLPIAVKDDSDIEGVVTSHGSGAYTTTATADSEMVRRLRAAGAIVVGKTALPEFGQWPFTESAAHGITRNPWDLERTPGGSSGGSAAAVAAGIVAAATGSDGGGSIRIPAACCGVFGLKPQRGRVSSLPYKDLWHGLGSYGVLTRDVEGAAALYDVISGHAPGDRQVAKPTPMPFVEAARTVPGSLRIRIVTQTGVPGVAVAEEQLRAVESTANVLTSLGHKIISDGRVLPLPTPSLLPRMSAGVRDDLRNADRPANVERRTRIWARLGAGLQGPVRAGGEGYARRAEGQVNRLFDDCDLLLTPTIAEVPRHVGALTDSGLLSAAWRSMPSIAFTAIFNVTGHPAASVPAGTTAAGVPLGVQLVAPAHRDTAIIQVAAQLEQAQSWGDRLPGIACS